MQIQYAAVDTPVAADGCGKLLQGNWLEPNGIPAFEEKTRASGL